MVAWLVLLAVVSVVDVPYAVPDVVVGTVVAVVVVVAPVSGLVEDRVVWLQPARTSPSSAAMKIVFFIDGLSCAATDRAQLHRFAWGSRREKIARSCSLPTACATEAESRIMHPARCAGV